MPVLIARDRKTISQGLSDLPFLPPDTGMLFLLPERYIPAFWMKNMHFPLDIIWIDNNSVVDIAHDCPAEGRNPSVRYRPETPVEAVLEVNAGFAEKNSIQVGDRVILPSWMD